MTTISPMQGFPLAGVAQPWSGESGSARFNPTTLGSAVASQARPIDGGGEVAAGSAGVASTGTPIVSMRGADELKKLVADMQTRLSGANAKLVFSVDQDSGRSVVKVTERSTNEVIWQFPTEQALQVSKELGRYLGALVNRTA